MEYYSSTEGFPRLQKLYIKLWSDQRYGRDSQFSRSQRSHSHRKRVYFVNFGWTKKHIKSVVSVLRNSVALERMSIEAHDVCGIGGIMFHI